MKKSSRLKSPTSSSLRSSDSNLLADRSLALKDSLHSFSVQLSKPMALSRPLSASMRPKRPLSSSVGTLFLKSSDRPKSAKLNSNEKFKKKSVTFGNVPEKVASMINRCPTPGANVVLNDLDMKETDLKEDQPVAEIKMHNDRDDELNQEFFARLENEYEYMLTPFQTAIYDRILPNSDDGVKAEVDGSRLYIARAIRFNQYVNYSDLKLAVNRVVALYPILQTTFFRNDKILDADVIGTLPQSKEWEPESDAFVEVMSTINFPELLNPDPELLADFATKWMRNHLNFNQLFKVLYIPLEQDLSNQSSYTLIFVGANIVLDQQSMIYLNTEIVNLFNYIVGYRQLQYSDRQIHKLVSNYKAKEKTTFLQFSQGCVDSKFSMDFWRTQCIESVQETIEDDERDKFKTQLDRLKVEKYNLNGSKDSLTKRINNLSHDLGTLKNKRKKLDSGSNGEGPMTKFIDPTTQEVIIISVEAKDALLQSVLGMENGVDNISAFLDKHSVPKDVQRKINAPSMSIEKFADITQESLANVPILTKERRKIVALAEYVSSRVRESFHQQHKIKGDYERRILKVKRDLDKATEMLAVVKERLEVNDDMAIRLNALLNPPRYDERIMPLNLNTVSAAAYDSKLYTNQTDYSFIPFTVSEDAVNQLRNFREAFLLSKQSEKGSGSSSVEMISSSDDSDVDKYNEETQTHQRSIRNANSVCIAAFCVLLRHISGEEKFSIGLTQSYRYRDMLVGPVSDTVPLKVDLTKKNLKFHSLFSKMYRGLYHARYQGTACPLTKISKKYLHVKNLPIRFEYVSYKEYCRWEKAGISLHDLMDTSSSNYSKLWTINENNTFDLKLIMVEKQNSIEGGFLYRSEKFTPGQITKWMIKFQSILTSIEYSQRKIRISTMISRYLPTLIFRLYHSMWTKVDRIASSTASFSSFTELQSQLDLYSDDNSSVGDIDYSQDTLAASFDSLSASKLPSIRSEDRRYPHPHSNKTNPQVKSTDTIYLENLKI